ncbi:hypothetical protein [Commensalibacter papalotli (ex Botero et al. 2024)]|uniref:Tetratricopeptide repeat protein n=1 Tax=Commensalibacter papalotli (ex Botero et al. 2024) TaxID=2972766 RepID=A0ABM9HPN9_9PROT|nr:hypothetical protein [Commensalibacter papalotli (ex Botero et al. 2024)]CAI3932132.1 unnamed protein product [Commensalibacter papalotli (ex Botero et al. 2024)]CAI3943552.1 unnamed protein product [Commensalibacter papalotli (ex Botero et al. 2024)]
MRILYKNFTILIPLLLGMAGCGGTEPPEPTRDDPFDRTMDVADEAVYYDQLQQAEINYKKSFDYALTSDDVANIDDAGYNLATIQLGLNNTQDALQTVVLTNNELRIRGQENSSQLDLVRAAILYRMNRLTEAAQAALMAEKSKHEDIQERSYFLSALIVNDQGDINALGQYVQKLDQLLINGKPKKEEEKSWKADQQELHALLSYKQGQYPQAMTAAKTAQDIRREQVEYRAMVRTLALQGQISEAMKDFVAAAQFYVRAGKSALLLKDYPDAKKYLDRATSLHADPITYQLASDALLVLTKKTKKTSE